MKEDTASRFPYPVFVAALVVCLVGFSFFL